MIPDKKPNRVRYFNRMVQQCLSSRAERCANYDKWRNYYLFGSATNRVRFNKLRSHLEDLSSLLFAEESVQFAATYGARAERGEPWLLETVREALNDAWHADGMGLTVAEYLPWSFVYGTILLAPRWRDDGVQLYGISPSAFGVANEKVNRLDRQEAFCVIYECSIPELIRMIPPGSDVDKIIRRVSPKAPGDRDAPEEQMPVVLSNVSGSNYSGAVSGSENADPYTPRVEQPVVEMRELWVYDEKSRDWRVITQAAPDVFIYDRKNLVSPGRIPFAKMTPNPLPDYFWGESEIDFLSGLQYWRNKRFSQIDSLLRRQENPPKIAAGFQGLTDEKLSKLNTEGTVISSMMPSAKVQELAPNVPANALEEIAALDSMFEVASGIPGQLFGNVPPNVRSHAHASAAAMLASSRPKRRAMRVEGALNDLVSLMFDIMRREDAGLYRGDDGQPIRLSNVPDSVQVKVDGHSSSPVFSIRNQMIATELFEAGAIDSLSLLEMLQPPMMDTLKERLKLKMEQEARHPQEAQKEEAAHRKAVSKMRAV